MDGNRTLMYRCKQVLCLRRGATRHWRCHKTPTERNTLPKCIPTVFEVEYFTKQLELPIQSLL